MATTAANRNFIVGDVQGCFVELTQLLAQLQFNPKSDVLWACGDLISRGPDSLATLRFFMSLGDHAKVVLGNHDLHLFCVAAGLKRGSRKDLQQELLAAPDLPQIIDWLRFQPLLRTLPEHNVVLTHAGLPPQWDLKTAQQRAAEVEAILQQDDYLKFCQQMYGVKPNQDNPAAPLYERATFTVNTLTRMRYLTTDGALEFEDKTPPTEDSPYIPWFAYPDHYALKHHRLVFGHWASLQGNTTDSNAIAIDLGCCWGGELCIWQAETGIKHTIPSRKKSKDYD
ncbi:symmetrical bis(5'-nucleosyl)-tetraphosphatase [Ferrimonas lipolytica]|uniref:bis(5'-nucleosyl)-tetraphosphatase (symmetrical) n=1 Tax=Ferrimonas lipolytica TaxID=2724191 RepID=A0A6H1UFE9_9GAMM|nr:symmetrical bis(5'-nucleosyl)-tetraphosphatase [Ferrimonas lipolytica]QIZ77827.1 symmetrical bis(5'-nucleosyl)-tetraphosphatase [Ferrimonas lipolytica]